MDTPQALAALTALAQETRLAVFRKLVQIGPEGLTAGAIAEAFGVPAATMSFHLSHLHRAGLLRQRRVSRQLIYAVDYDRMNGLLAFLAENCCGSAAAVQIPACAAPAATGAANTGELDGNAPAQSRCGC